MVVSLSIDLESVAKDLPSGKRDAVKEKEVNATRNLLNMLEREDHRSTFFVVPDHFSDEFISELHSHGHEVASHSLTHSILARCPAAKIREELEESKRSLERTIGDEVKGFRAPCLKGRRTSSTSSKRRAIRTTLPWSRV